MTPEIQALVTQLAKIVAWLSELEANALTVNNGEGKPLASRCDWAIGHVKEAAAALVQQAQLLEEKKEDPTRVDGQTVMPPERATAAENELNR